MAETCSLISSASEKVLQTPELLLEILHYLNQTNLLILRRVSRIWLSLIQSSRDLQQKAFQSPVHSTHVPGGEQLPRLNELVIKKLRWVPRLPLERVNASEFTGVASNHALQAMAYPTASWREQFLTLPVVQNLVVKCGTIMLQEDYLPTLVLRCDAYVPPQQGEGKSNEKDSEEEEDKGEEDDDEDDEEEEEIPPFVLSVDAFPHNAGRQVAGITMTDLLYGLRMYYLEREDDLNVYWTDNYEGGQILAKLIWKDGEVGLDMTFLKFAA